jgi:hypothetical protein
MIPIANPSQNAIVASQSPAGGTKALRGTSVTLTLYKFVEGQDEKGKVRIYQQLSP